jgi:hypothetical protein
MTWELVGNISAVSLVLSCSVFILALAYNIVKDAL